MDFFSFLYYSRLKRENKKLLSKKFNKSSYVFLYYLTMQKPELLPRDTKLDFKYPFAAFYSKALYKSYQYLKWSVFLADLRTDKAGNDEKFDKRIKIILAMIK